MSFLAADNRKKLGVIIQALGLIKKAGYLKDHAGCAGEVIYQNHHILFEPVTHGDTSHLTSVLEVVGGAGQEILGKYIALYFPVRVVKGTGKVKPLREESQEVEYYKKYLLDFDVFRKLSMAIDVSFDSLEQLRSAIAHDHRQNWMLVLARHLKWPSTDAPKSLSDLLGMGWVTAGILNHYEYRVGQEGAVVTVRQRALDRIISIELDAKIFEMSYIKQWGLPGSVARLMKLANTIAALCRNAKRSSKNFEQAIADWEDDLSYLKIKYFDQRLNLERLEWPETLL